MDNFRYLQEKCPVCGKEFEATDDIVVCPLCGTPHHRDCYKKNGECGNAEKHNEGFIWEPTQKETVNEQEFSQNENSNGAPVPPPFIENGIQFENPLNSFPPEFKDGTKTIDVAAFTQKGAFQYLKKFFSEEAGKKTFNFWALIFGGFWFVYRKMYKLGAIFIAITLVLSTIPVLVPQSAKLSKSMDNLATKLQTMDSSSVEQMEELYNEMFKTMAKYPVGIAVNVICSIADLAFGIYMGIIANKKYKEHINKQINTINSTAQTEDLRRNRIMAEGGTQFGFTILSVLAVEIIGTVITLLSEYIIK